MLAAIFVWLLEGLEGLERLEGELLGARSRPERDGVPESRNFPLPPHAAAINTALLSSRGEAGDGVAAAALGRATRSLA